MQRDSGDEDGPTLYECKKCPGRVYTAPEMDLHRQYHREERMGRTRAERQRLEELPPPPESSLFLLAQREREPEARYRPGPKSSRNGPRRAAAPAPEQRQRSGPRSSKGQKRTPTPDPEDSNDDEAERRRDDKKKITSAKRFKDVVFDTTTGG